MIRADSLVGTSVGSLETLTYTECLSHSFLAADKSFPISTAHLFPLSRLAIPWSTSSIYQLRAHHRQLLESLNTTNLLADPHLVHGRHKHIPRPRQAQGKHIILTQQHAAQQQATGQSTSTLLA